MSHLLTKNMVTSKIRLSRFATRRTTEELSNNIKESLKMKAALFQWVSRAADESTKVSDTKQLVAFVNGIGVEFNITELR
jgi:hypothetical protein